MFINCFKVSKIVVLLCVIELVAMSCIVMSAADLAVPFDSDSGPYWQYISSQVMVGVSDGTVTIEQDGEMYYARLTGNVSTRNNGGVIQLRTGISFANYA